MQKHLIIVLASILLVLAGCQSTDQGDLWGRVGEHDIPIAQEGSVVEVVSPAEVLVEAYGIYYGQGYSQRAQRRDVEEHGNEQALLDARRTAIHVLLFEGSTPLLTTLGERSAFERDRAFFYHPENLNRYITYEDTLFRTRLLIDDSTGMKVSKRFKINKDRLIEDLSARRITLATATVRETLGNPMIMVLPNAESNRSPLEILADDPTARQSSTIIQSHLTAKGYEVVVPEQSGEIANIISMQQGFDSAGLDLAYQLALTIGSDIYMTFSGYSEEASFDTTRYVATLNIFESTTSRLLGSETGYGKGRKGELGVSIEEAFNDAIDKALIRVMGYWKDDLKKGVQYKVIATMTPNLDSYDIDSMHLAFLDAIDQVAIDSRELVLTERTIDYIIWVDPLTYDRPLRLYQALKEAFERSGTGATMGRTSLNRKLMQLTIDY